jgi:hypothetical protein
MVMIFLSKILDSFAHFSGYRLLHIAMMPLFTPVQDATVVHDSTRS